MFKLTVFFQIRLILKANNSNASHILKTPVEGNKWPKIKSQRTRVYLHCFTLGADWRDIKHREFFDSLCRTRIVAHEFLAARKMVIFALLSNRINDFTCDIDGTSLFRSICNYSSYRNSTDKDRTRIMRQDHDADYARKRTYATYAYAHYAKRNQTTVEMYCKFD